MATNFGVKEKFGGCEPCPSAKKETKVVFPKACFRDEQVDKLEGVSESPLNVGDEIEVTTRFRVSGIRKDEYGKTIDMEVVSMGEASDVESESEEDDSTMESEGEDDAEPTKTESNKAQK